MTSPTGGGKSACFDALPTEIRRQIIEVALDSQINHADRVLDWEEFLHIYVSPGWKLARVSREVFQDVIAIEMKKSQVYEKLHEAAEIVRNENSERIMRNGTLYAGMEDDLIKQEELSLVITGLSNPWLGAVDLWTGLASVSCVVLGRPPKVPKSYECARLGKIVNEASAVDEAHTTDETHVIDPARNIIVADNAQVKSGVCRIPEATSLPIEARHFQQLHTIHTPLTSVEPHIIEQSQPVEQPEAAKTIKAFQKPGVLEETEALEEHAFMGEHEDVEGHEALGKYEVVDGPEEVTPLTNLKETEVVEKTKAIWQSMTSEPTRFITPRGAVEQAREVEYPQTAELPQVTEDRSVTKALYNIYKACMTDRHRAIHGSLKTRQLHTVQQPLGGSRSRIVQDLYPVQQPCKSSPDYCVVVQVLCFCITLATQLICSDPIWKSIISIICIFSFFLALYIPPTL